MGETVVVSPGDTVAVGPAGGGAVAVPSPAPPAVVEGAGGAGVVAGPAAVEVVRVPGPPGGTVAVENPAVAVVAVGVQGPAGPGAGPQLTLTFGWNNATPRLVGTVPAGHTVSRCRVDVTTAFLDPASGLSVGTAGDPAALVSPGQCDPPAGGAFETAPLLPCPADTPVYLTLAPGPAEAAGAGVVAVEYEPTSGG